MTYSSMLFSLLCCISTLSRGQTCQCQQNFNWVKKTVEANDAGYQTIIERKGKRAYTAHTNAYSQKIKSAKTTPACAALINEWIHFFRKGHIGVFPADEQNDDQTNTHWKKITISLPSFKQQLTTQKIPDYEGIWNLDSYKIGIIKEKNQYIGFIIESTNPAWKQHEIKLSFTKGKEQDRLVYYTNNKATEEYNQVALVGNNYLQAGDYLLKREFPTFGNDDRHIEAYYKRITAKQAYLDTLNEKTLYLRIPSFNLKYKKNIDSVILANKSKFLTTENLVIDLLDNGGGGDDSYQELLPFLYTNPVRTIAAARRSTKLNNQTLLDNANNPDYNFSAEDKKWATQSYTRLESQLGQFVNLGNGLLDVEKRDTIYAYPKTIGILINEHNGSTTEQFLLAAKQSKKVKLFGRTTFGALDMSNLNVVKSPSKDIVLIYATSRSFRLPGMPIDDLGIQPDYYLDKSIPLNMWVDFVNRIVNIN